jgi:F-type H+-transporting ATPase subunit g
MAVRLAQLRTKAAQAADFASKHGGAYYKEAMEKNKQYVVFSHKSASFSPVSV